MGEKMSENEKLVENLHKRVLKYIMDEFFGNCGENCPSYELCNGGRVVCDELNEKIEKLQW